MKDIIVYFSLFLVKYLKRILDKKSYINIVWCVFFEERINELQIDNRQLSLRKFDAPACVAKHSASQ